MTSTGVTKNTVVQKIFNIASQDLYVQKTGWNKHHDYKYATEADVVRTMREKLKEQKLVYHFSVLDSQQIHNDVIRVTYEFTLIDVESGDRFACTVVADGQDKGDKGPYKAFTGAQKYFFMKLFLIATGDDPESTGDQLPTEASEEKEEKVATLRSSRFNRSKKEEPAAENETTEEEAKDDGEEAVAEAERKVSRFSRGKAATEESEETTLKSSRRFKPGQRFKQG